jgi:arylsulfatase A-like enzyme
MVEKVDREIGKVLSAVRQASVEQNTLVIFTSDHGECVGAHRFNQKTVFYEESARVPLIISWKGKTAAAISNELVNTGVDILPTVMECAGLKKPDNLPGRSILPLALGQEARGWREFLVVQNNMVQTGEIDGVKPTMQGRMVRSDQYKYCVYERGVQREALYDLREDPLETVNLAGEPRHRHIVLEHRRLLRQFAEKHADSLAEKLLANDVGPRPFALQTTNGQ